MMGGVYLRRIGRLLFLGELDYRRAMEVAEIHVFPRCRGTPAYPVCPRCERTMEREYTAYCSRCGQKLGWRSYEKARIVYIKPEAWAARQGNG